MDRNATVRDALRRTRILANRVRFSTGTRREVNGALDTLESQIGRNQINALESARAFELLNRAHASLFFGLLSNPAVTDRFGPALRALGLRGIEQRLDEVPHSVMAVPIPGPTGGRRHRDELPAAERNDASGQPLPPPRG